MSDREKILELVVQQAFLQYAAQFQQDDFLPNLSEAAEKAGLDYHEVARTVQPMMVEAVKAGFQKLLQ